MSRLFTTGRPPSRRSPPPSELIDSDSDSESPPVRSSSSLSSGQDLMSSQKNVGQHQPLRSASASIVERDTQLQGMVLKEGWANYRRADMRWEPRWCVLDDEQTLRFFHNDYDAHRQLNLIAVVSLANASIIRTPHAAAELQMITANALALVSPTDRVLLQFSDASVRRGWVRMLEVILERKPYVASHADLAPASASASAVSRSTSPMPLSRPVSPAFSVPSFDGPDDSNRDSPGPDTSNKTKNATFGVLRVSGQMDSAVKSVVEDFSQYLHFSKFDNSFRLSREEQDLTGWAGSMDRVRTEARLKGCPVGTYLTRWSSDGSSLVISFVKTSTPFTCNHIAYVALQRDRSVMVLESDKKIARYLSLADYFSHLKKQRVLSHTVAHELL